MLLSVFHHSTKLYAQAIYHRLTVLNHKRVALPVTVWPFGTITSNSYLINHPTCTQLISRLISNPCQTSTMGLSSSLLSTPAGKMVQDTVHSDCVVIFSKTNCGFCKMAKHVFSQMGVSYTAIELNNRPDGDLIQDVLVEMTGQTTVPRVFINSKCIGGGNETRELYKKGTLMDLVSKCKVRKANLDQS